MNQHLIIPVLFVTLCFNITIGQSDKFEAEMLEALSLHESAKSASEELISAKKLAVISDLEPTNWVAAYWTSFVYSQVANASEDKLSYLETSLSYFNRVETQFSTLSDKEKSYVMALKALISSLYQVPYFIKGDTKRGMEFVNLQKQAMEDGFSYDGESPLLMVLKGTSSIGAGYRNKPAADYEKIDAGKVLLEKAKKIFNAMPLNNKLIPDRWNEPWIDFWLQRVNQG
ncbi:MAG: hypothetical protein AAF039_12530 [Bacteroidota bacterium]